MSINVFKRPILLQSRLFKCYKMFFLAFLILCVYSCKKDNNENENTESTNTTSECECGLENGADAYTKQITVDIARAGEITLYVKSDELWKSAYPANMQTIDNLTALVSSGKLSSYGDPKKNFETKVQKGEKLTWDIYHTNDDDKKKYKLSLISINMKPKEDNINYFQFSSIPADKKKIKGTVRDMEPDSDNIYPDYHYYITFILEDENREIRVYDVDPKLKMYAETIGNDN